MGRTEAVRAALGPEGGALLQPRGGGRRRERRRIEGLMDGWMEGSVARFL